MGQSQRARGPAFQLWGAVQRFRRENQLTLEQFASRAGVGRQTLDRLKDGKKEPRLVTVHKIADVLGMDHDDAERLAGYEPVEQMELEETPTERADAADLAVDTREAILRDPKLGEHAAVVLATYDAIVNAFNRPAPAKIRPAAEQPGEQKRAS